MMKKPEKTVRAIDFEYYEFDGWKMHEGEIRFAKNRWSGSLFTLSTEKNVYVKDDEANGIKSTITRKNGKWEWHIESESLGTEASGVELTADDALDRCELMRLVYTGNDLEAAVMAVSE